MKVKMHKNDLIKLLPSYLYSINMYIRIVLLYLLFLLTYASFAPHSPRFTSDCNDPNCAICYADPAVCEVCSQHYYLNENTCKTC